MQALVIQQDAISELHKAVIGKKPIISTTTSWIAIRDFRNLCAGHPANKSIGLPAPKRSFMGRHFGTDDAIKYEQWDAHAQKTTHPAVNLTKLVFEYDVEARNVLASVLSHMKKHWP